jgi:hypothetical protein
MSMAGPAKTRPLQNFRAATAGPFQAITLIVLILIGLASFSAATYLQVFDDGSGEPRSDGADSYSRSAIGHRAFVQTLRRLGIPVTTSRFDTLGKVGENTLLLVIEPSLDGAGKDILDHLGDVAHALLVLPKWTGRTDPSKPIWIDRMNLIPAETIEPVLQSVLRKGTIHRKSGMVSHHSDRFDGKLVLNDPQYFATNDATYIASLIETPDGMLLGADYNGGGDLWILSDPDLLSNAGIHEADNGVIAVSIVQALLPKGGSVIIDETAHGFEQRPNLLRTMLRMPFLAVTISTLVVLILLIWAGAIRFGAPRPELEALPAGKLTLIRNAGKLLRLGLAPGELLQSYRRLIAADAFAELHGPAGLDENAQAAWLDRATRHRKGPLLSPLTERIAADAAARRVNPRQVLKLAIELHRWKQEISNGTGLDTRRR